MFDNNHVFEIQSVREHLSSWVIRKPVRLAITIRCTDVQELQRIYIPYLLAKEYSLAVCDQRKIIKPSWKEISGAKYIVVIVVT